MDIAVWLRSLGLEQYEAGFRDNAIDGSVLPRLTRDDLKDIGVVQVGHRRKLLDAIAALEVPEPPPTSSAVTAPGGERRQLTVMFCDLVGSTALSEKLDPEELRSLLHGYRTHCGEVIARYDGFVARYVGDGILTYFGWPTAHEEDAERAVRAALEIVHTVKRASSTENLSVRIGIATGPVVVGEAAGTGDQSKLAVGSTPNLAARLQGLATADQIVIAASTRRLVGNSFELIDLGESDLKGIAEPVHAWRVERALLTESRFDANRGGSALTPLVGREEELDRLLRRWAQAKDGEGQVVLLSGEPGIGKSRILSALRERLEAQGVQALRFQCSPYYVNSAFWPIIDNFERALKFIRDETTDAKLDKLEALIVTRYGRPLADVRFVASILSIPFEARYGALPMTLQKHKDETLRTLVDITEAAARQQPNVMLFEDTHWADPTSLEVLDLLIDRVKTIPLLVVLTHRPEFQSRWSQQGHVGALNLSKLTRTQSAAIVSTLTDGKPLPAGLLEQILTRTDGVPLFVEELTKSILESGELKDASDHYEFGGSARAVTIPATLRDSLMARLDRFMPVKEIAQIGAAIGREFSYELIAAVAPTPQAQLDDALGRLTESGLAFRRGTPPDAIYTFKHALVQDAAYDSLLKRRRQELHGKIARVIEQRFPSIKTIEPELLAHHYTEGGWLDQAAGYWHKAGQQAAQRSAHAESFAYLTKGLKALASLPDTLERDQLELALQTALGPVLMATQGYASPDAGQAYHRAYELCSQLGEAPQIFQVLLGLRQFHHIGGALQRARELGEQLLELALKLQNPLFLVQAHTMLGHTLCYTGEFVNAQGHLEKAVAFYDRQQHHAHILLSGLDPGVLCRGASAWVLWHLGYPDRALERAHTAISLAIELTHSQSLAQALGSTGQLHQFRREEAATLEHAEREIAVARERGFQMRFAMASVLRGWALVGKAENTQGIVQMHQALAAYRATGAGASNALYLSLLAQRYEQGQQIAEAHSALEEAFAWVRKSGERWCEAELHRLKGTLLMHQMIPDDLRAETSFLQALDIARRQQAKSWELRASVSLSRLWQSQGKPREAHELLAPVYGWFTEGFDTKDLQEAKALLAELG